MRKFDANMGLIWFIWLIYNCNIIMVIYLWFWGMIMNSWLALQALEEKMKEVRERWGAHGSEASEAKYREEMAKIRKDMVDFHGEMVLLVHYSSINYTGTTSSLFKSFFFLLLIIINKVTKCTLSHPHLRD